MKIKDNGIRVPRGDGSRAHAYFQYGLAGHDITGKTALEIGPKHGHHTRLLQDYGIASITLVELPSKEPTLKWVKDIKCPVEVHYEDFLRWESDEKFDVLVFCGVLYHNMEQLRLLKKLRALANEDARLIFESSTTRTLDLMERNVIEVHWPKGYRGLKTIMFHPSKLACRSMLEIAGWEIVCHSDETKRFSTRDRWICIAKPTDVATSYEELDHTYVP